MTPLAKILVDRIAASGPITLADYMAECLLHPLHGYYSTRDPFGQVGDFTTAPEISQMFGECLGLCLAQAWLDQGRPAPFILAELGPGRGTLMRDVLRATAAVPGFREAAEVHLVEASAVLRERQAALLVASVTAWHDTVFALPDGPLFLLANEFFDALPVRQFQRSGDSWRELQVGVKDGALAFGLSAPVRLAKLEHRLDDTGEGDIVELCAALPAIAGEIGARVAEYGGAALVIDYGAWRSRGDTIQALREHRYEPVLANPGDADLTAHVDFEALSHAGRPAAASNMTAQGRLLERLGITARAQALARKLEGEALENHVAAHRRLTHPEEMGRLFKALALYSPRSPAPPGFE